jgi:hypothetical protein
MLAARLNSVGLRHVDRLSLVLGDEQLNQLKMSLGALGSRTWLYSFKDE